MAATDESLDDALDITATGKTQATKHAHWGGRIHHLQVTSGDASAVVFLDNDATTADVDELRDDLTQLLEGERNR